MKVALIDYGAGNIPSVERALQRLGANSERISAPEGLAKADAMLLPGVGHYGALIRALDERALRGPLVDAVKRGVPFLGICLGLQVMFEASEEAPELAGLHLFPGSVRALPGTVKLPHMGWNQLQRKRESGLLAGVPACAYFYFAHSYAAMEAQGQDSTSGTCTHGAEFAAVLEKGNIFGVQFHPEKSGAAGEQVLRNFLRLAA